MRTNIALVYGTQVGFEIDLVAGITKYAQERTRWTIELFKEHAHLVAQLSHWRIDGVIYGANHDVTGFVRRTGVPAVTIEHQVPGIPMVGIDDDLVGRRGAEYLVHLGPRRFAFCGRDDYEFSIDRHRGFARALGEAGFTCEYLDHRLTFADRGEYEHRLRDIAAGGASPLAIMACNDDTALGVIRGCRAIGLRVPEDVRIIGVDDNGYICRLADPPITSLPIRASRIGWDAAAVLDDLLRGRSAPVAPVRHPPGDIVVRRSSEVLAVDDDDVAAAIHYIRANAHRPIDVHDVAAAVSLSRRTLERRLRAMIGRSPLAEIHLVRIARAKPLLAQSEKTIAEIAHETGFSGISSFSRIFRQYTGNSPAAYRRKYETRR